MTSASRTTTRRGMVLAAFLVSLFGAANAHATVTHTEITSPARSFTFADLTVAQNDPANLLTVTGTSDGTTGDQVTIRCQNGAPDADVGSDGSFSATINLTSFDDTLCTLRAVPAGVFPTDLSPYSGPLIGNGSLDVDARSDGPYNYTVAQPQAGAGSSYYSIGSCGLCDSNLYGAGGGRGGSGWSGNAGVFNGTYASAGKSYEYLTVDGKPAFGPFTAQNGNRQALDLPILTFTHAVDPVTGNLEITERDPLSFCLPSGIRNCTSFEPSGLTLDRTITTGHDGRVIRIADVFTSTDGAPHTLAVGYYESYSPGAQPGYQFPGESEFTAHVSGESIFGRAAPSATVLATGNRTLPTSLSNPIGAMTLAPAPEGYRFLGRAFEFAVSYKETVPAGGSSTISHSFALAESRDELDGYVAENADELLAPTVAITTPAADGSTVDAADLAVSGTASDDTTGLTVNGTSTAVSGGEWSRTLTLTPGANTITVVVRDGAGNTTTASREVTYVPPAATAPAAAAPTPAPSILAPAPVFPRRCAVDGIPSNRFSISAHTKGRGGTILVRALVPGCGRLQLLGTHGKPSAAKRAQLAPGAGRFAWGSKTVRTRRAGRHTVVVRVEPNQRGRALMARYASTGSRLRIRLTVGYRPDGGVTRRHVVLVRVPVPEVTPAGGR